MWFERDVFKNLIDEKDEDADLDKTIEEYKKKGAQLIGKDVETSKAATSSDSDYSSEEMSDYDVEEEHAKSKKAKEKDGFEVVKDAKGKLKTLEK